MLFDYPVVGFSGSRHLSGIDLDMLSYAVECVPSSARVFAGCAMGVDSYFRSAFYGRVEIFHAVSPARGLLVARSVRFVRSLLSNGGCLVSFPSHACPVSVAPSTSSSRCFCGSGSGSWASLAFAVGLGVPCFVCLPVGVPAPAWLVSASASESCGFYIVPGSRQLALL
jgi:hypothetical protein